MLDTFLVYIKKTYENVKERLKNPFSHSNQTPFAGAFLIAIIFYNWELFFSLFSFDDNETRESKINIIKKYLENEVWYSRIWMTILLAFGSIILFYIFNYLSLGLTTFFNRWYKGWILYFTDRSQTLPRSEFDRSTSKINLYKKNYDDLNDLIKDVEDERDELSLQLTNLTSQYSDANSEIEQLKKTIEQIENSKSSKTAIHSNSENIFKIVYAQYGINNEIVDVTKKVSDIFKSKKRFTVNNKTLGVDPSKFFIKELLIKYISENQTLSLIVNEEQLVELKDNKLIATPTEKSRIKESFRNNEKKISEIFIGEWILSSNSLNKNFKEKVIINEDGKYYSNLRFSFYLKSIHIDQNTKKITFNKVKPDRTLHSKEDLTIVNDKLIKGVDSLGYTLEYSKVN